MFLILSPVFFILLIILGVEHGGKPFFKQKRPGKNGEVFQIFKFKTMSDRRDLDGNLLPDSDRITFLGRLVRKSSLDEIPQLINIIRGEMSLVGPRPLLVEYLPLYSDRQAKRHNVLPGITGWAQINGRNTISWEQKFELDVWYVENLNFWLDFKILIKTFFNVIKGKGVSQQGHVSMGRFKGSNFQKEINHTHKINLIEK
ncbi:sugar transferase [Algoriphagus kandeliae]|uniref:Sugar transferase n=2 Tax=Algoriphagus kandeliae TaxID=2562278 RepID=A0A4Y9R086_9BACT|nr:sugar transferase [Algoriphagus kandeliae]